MQSIPFFCAKNVDDSRNHSYYPEEDFERKDKELEKKKYHDKYFLIFKRELSMLLKFSRKGRRGSVMED